MKNLITLIVIATCGYSTSSFAQSKAKEVVVTEAPQRSVYKNLLYKEPVYSAVEIQPTFPGGMEKFFKYLSDNVKYPAVESSSSIPGKIFVEFIIEKDGSITNAKVLRPGWAALDREVVRVIANSPKWKPGAISGKIVRTKYALPMYLCPRSDE